MKPSHICAALGSGRCAKRATALRSTTVSCANRAWAWAIRGTWGEKPGEIYGNPMKHGEIMEKTYGNPRKIQGNPMKNWIHALLLLEKA